MSRAGFLLEKPLRQSDGVRSRDCKTSIIELLRERHPLTLKEITAELSRGRDGPTYQAVHKVTADLLSTGVVSKLDKGFELSVVWIAEQKLQWSRAQEEYSGGRPRLKEIPEGTAVLHTFTGIISVPYWVIDEIPQFLSKSSPLYEHWYFAWPAQMVGPEEHKKVKLFAKSGGKRILCRDASKGSIYCLKYLEKVNGSRWIAPANVASECDVLAFKDYVINVYWPSEFKELMVRALSSNKLEEAMKRVYDYVFYGPGSKMKVPVVIIHDSRAARQIIAQSREKFNGRK